MYSFRRFVAESFGIGAVAKRTVAAKSSRWMTLLFLTLGASSVAFASGVTVERIDNAAVAFGSDGQSDQLGQVVAVDSTNNIAVVGAPGDGVGEHALQGSAYVFVRSGTAWSLQAKLTAPDGGTNDYFGGTVSVSGTTVAIGAYGHTGTGPSCSNCGATYVFVRSGTTWSLQQEILAADATPGNSIGFGYSVAISGDTVLIGEGRNATLATAAAHVYVRSGTSWSKQQTLQASDAATVQPSSYFGHAVALDTNIAVIGDQYWYDGIAGYSGAAYIFVRSGTTWTQQAQTHSDDNEYNSYYGSSVSVSGTTVSVGAAAKTVSGNAGQGAVYVYTQSGANWPLQQKVTTTDGVSYGYFGGPSAQGNAVSLAGSTIAIAASNGSSGLGGARTYIFTRSGSTWTQQKIIRGGTSNGGIGSAGIALNGNTLLAGAPQEPACGKAFVQTGSGSSWSAQGTGLDRGCSPVYPYSNNNTKFGQAVSADNGSAVVGSSTGYLVNGAYQGRAYVFTHQASGWLVQQQLLAPSSNNGDGNYAQAVAISGDTVAVGAPSHYNPSGMAGAVYIFQRSGTTWTLQAELNAGVSESGFGTALALRGNTLVVGSPYGSGSNGAAYVFTRSGTTWSVPVTLVASDGSSSAQFGASVGLDETGNTALIGAPDDQHNGSGYVHGSAYIFTLAGATWTQKPKLTAPDSAANVGEAFGASVTISGANIAIGAPTYQVASGTSGQVYAYVRSGSVWTYNGTLFGSGTQNFGYSISMDGASLSVGSPGGDEATSYGGVYLYLLSGGTWNQQDELFNPALTNSSPPYDYFGNSVSISRDVTLIGAPNASGVAPYGSPGDGAAFTYSYVEASTTKINSIASEPSHVGSAATVTVEVDGERFGPTDGTVAVNASTGETCTVTALTSTIGSVVSTGTCQITFTTLGVRTLSASYSGSPTYDPSSTSVTSSHTVDKAVTTLAISSVSPTTSVSGQTYTVTATLSGAYQPTGTITVGNGTTTCPILLPATNCNLVSTTAGTKTVTASYPGDSLNLGSTAPTVNHTVNKASTITVIGSATPNPAVVGQSYSVSGSVAAVAPGAGIPTGTVTVSDGTTTSPICTLNGSGAYTCTLASSSIGAATLTATYSGDANFLTSNGAGSQQINKDSTTTTVATVTSNPSVVGQTYTVSGSVNSGIGGSGTPTGTVSVSDGVSTSPACTLAGGAYTCSLSSSSAGSKTLTATYAGDGKHLGSFGTGSQSITTATTTTVISTVTSNPSVVGQSYTVSGTVTVVAPGSGTPTGSVTVSDGTATSPPCTLGGGAYVCALASASVGSKTLTASYAGDGNYKTSSGTHAQQINAAATTTSIATVTSNPSVVGQSYSVSGTVVATSPGSGTPTGTITVKDGTGAGSVSNTCSLSSGAYNCSLTSISAGAKTLTATYGSDSNFLGSSGTHAQQIDKTATTTTISTVSPNPAAVNQSYAVTGTVTASAPGAGTPTGTVTVVDGTGPGSATTNCTLSAGAFTCNLTSISSGAKTLTATYASDANYLASNGTHAQQVNKNATTTVIGNVSLNPVVVGQSYTITGTVVVSAPGSGTPTGSVTVTDGSGAGSASSTCPVNSGAYTCNLSSITAGAKTLTATYSGDTGNLTSAGTSSQQVNKAATATAITLVSPTPVAVGENYTISGTVNVSLPGAGVPTGSITVNDGTGGGSSSANCALSNNTFSCTLTSATSGAKTITATYGGDANYATSSGTSSQQVSAAAILAIAPTGPTHSQYGKSITYTIEVSNTAGSTATATVTDTLPPQFIAGTANWTCVSSPGATCTASGSGNLSDSATIPVGGNVTYLLTATLDTEANIAAASVTNTASAKDTSNNNVVSADVVTTLVVFRSGFEGPGSDGANPALVQSGSLSGNSTITINIPTTSITSRQTETIVRGIVAGQELFRLECIRTGSSLFLHIISNDGLLERAGAWIDATGQGQFGLGLASSIAGTRVVFATAGSTQDLPLPAVGTVEIYAFDEL